MNRRFQFLLVLTGIILAASAPAPVHAAEPQYQGVTLTRWFARFCIPRVPHPANPIGAMQAMSPQSIIYLDRLLDAPDDTRIYQEIGQLEEQEELELYNSYASLFHRRHKHSIGPSSPNGEPSMVRQNAWNALWQLKPDADILIPLAVSRLDSTNAETRKIGFDLVILAGKGAEKAVPYLIHGLTDENPTNRLHAAWMIGRTGLHFKGLTAPEFKGLVAPLIGGIATNSGHVLDNMVWALGGLGTRATEAVPALEKLLANENEELRIAAAESICRIDPGHARALQIVTTAVGDLRYCYSAIVTLADLPQRPGVPLELLTDVLNRSPWYDNLPMLNALITLGVPKARIISGMNGALVPPPPPPAPAAPAKDARAAAQAAAAQAAAIASAGSAQIQIAANLLQIDPNNSAAITMLLHFIKVNGLRAIRPAEALGNAGPNAANAIPELKKLLKDADPWATIAIKAALEKLEPKKPDSNNPR